MSSSDAYVEHTLTKICNISCVIDFYPKGWCTWLRLFVGFPNFRRKYLDSELRSAMSVAFIVLPISLFLLAVIE